MTNHIYRSIQEPIRRNLNWDQRWKLEDLGLIICWERGRDKSKEAPDLAECARRGELPVLPWKGGVEKKIKKKHKYGSLCYLAMWQGLRGEDLNIQLDREIELECSKTGMKVIFTPDSSKYAET